MTTCVHVDAQTWLERGAIWDFHGLSGFGVVLTSLPSKCWHWAQHIFLQTVARAPPWQSFMCIVLIKAPTAPWAMTSIVAA